MEKAHIILIGFMGAGKSSIGRRLAKALACEFIDTDEWIVRKEGRSINDIFKDSGETYFRDLETQALRELKDIRSRCVIAVGGGLPVREENRTLLKELGTVIYLRAMPDTLVKRLEGSADRPMLHGFDLKARILELMEKREGFYLDAAEKKLWTDALTVAETVERCREFIIVS